MDYRYLKNIRNLNAFFRGATSSEIKSILEKLTALYENVKSQEEAVLKKKQEREAFLSSVLNSLDSHNYTIDDLAALKGLKTNKAKMKPRYEYVDLNGETQYWSGQGKIPKEMKKVMDRDSITDKKHYLIQDEED